MSRSTKSLNNFKYAFFGQFFGIIISFISRIVFVKLLGSSYLGLNGLFTNILTVLSLAELGIGEAINFSLYKPLSENDNKKCKMLMQFYKKTYIIIGIIVLVLGLMITPFLPYFIEVSETIENISLIYILFVINTSISYFYAYKRNLIIADQNRYIATIYRYGFYFILNILQIILLIFTKNYIGYLILQILCTFLENYFLSKKADKMYNYLTEKDVVQLDVESKEEITKNTKAMMMHKIGGIVVSSTDNIIISKFVNIMSVGLYSNYCMITSALNSIYSQIYNSVIASIGNLCVDSDKNKQYEIFNKLDFLGFCLYSFSFVCLLNLLNPFITVWLGENYTFDIYIVLVISLNFYIGGMRKSNLTFREASGLFYKDRWKPIVEAIVNLIFSIFLVKKIGLNGVLIGTLISSLSVCVWVEPFVLFKYGFNISVKKYFKNYILYFIFTLFVEFQVFIVMNFVLSDLSLNIYFSIIIRLIICVFIYSINFFVFYRKNNNFKYYIGLIKQKIIPKVKNEM